MGNADYLQKSPFAPVMGTNELSGAFSRTKPVIRYHSATFVNSYGERMEHKTGKYVTLFATKFQSYRCKVKKN